MADNRRVSLAAADPKDVRLKTHPAGEPEQWLDDHGTALYSFALARIRDEHLAEEAVQETLLAALESRERFSGAASVRTWLIGILKHKIMDHFRRASREAPLDDPAGCDDLDEGASDEMFAADGHWRDRMADWGDPQETLERSQFMAILQRCLDALPPRLARLFWLREVMEEDSEIICKELAITPTNLWTMLHRGRLGLRQCLDRNWVGNVTIAARG
ncbi:MAG: sigma-70 family RNA polymerase sigma factor [Pseudomonadota bacterium]|nr:sigma-70 family RNA polymerase sigma factor [Pseudomonadota bacterium]